MNVINRTSTALGDVAVTKPTLSRRRDVFRRIAAASALAIVASIPFAMQSASADDASTKVIDEAKFVELINKERAVKGAGPLTVHVELVRVARGWTQKMRSDGDISHNPNLAQEVNATWRKLGENVGVGPEVDLVHEAFVKSPSHYKNIMDPAFDHVGVTIEYDENIFYVTEQFMDLDDRTIGATARPPLPTDNKAPQQLALRSGTKTKKAPSKQVSVKNASVKKKAPAQKAVSK